MAQRPVQEPSLRDVVKRRLANVLRDKPGEKFNVLIVGMPGSGKSSFINSMSMAVIGTWKEIAPYGGSDDERVTIRLKRCTMFDDDCHEVYQAHPMPDYRKNIVFWDCAGFNDADEKVYSKFVSLALDDRIPSDTNVLDCIQKKPRQLEREFPKKENPITFDRIVFILEAYKDAVIPSNLAKAIKSGAQRGHDVPIFVVVTKIDKCANPNDLTVPLECARTAFNLRGNRDRFKQTSLYCEELTSYEDPNDHRVMRPNEQIDQNMLNIWMNLTDPIHHVTAAAAPEEPPWWRRCLRCAP